MAGALLTDLYELNMAASYLRREMTAPATFSLYVRELPPNRGFLVAAGIDDTVAWLEQFGFEPEDLEYLAGQGFDPRTLESFARLRFTGEVWAIPEGRIVFAREPIIEVTAPIAEAQLVETYLLNQITFQTTLASKAARFRLACRERIELVDFGFRRTQGIETGVTAARLAAIAGFSGTSNVEAARRFGLRGAGTMAHSYIEAFASELDAFYSFAEDMPDRTTFLVDTYDTLRGVDKAIEVISRLGLGDRAGVRLDSGDLAWLARETRRRMDEAGLPAVRIFASGGLDEHDVARFADEAVPVDAVGIGTRWGVSADAPYLDTVYKLVSYDGRPVVKLSEAKATLPAAKQVFRGDSVSDWIGLRDEPVPPGTAAMLEPVMIGGRALKPASSLPEARSRFEADLDQLPASARTLDVTSPVVAGMTPALASLEMQVRAAALGDVSDS
jgi:nicotinate phosphoribosyltransferase